MEPKKATKKVSKIDRRKLTDIKKPKNSKVKSMWVLRPISLDECFVDCLKIRNSRRKSSFDHTFLLSPQIIVFQMNAGLQAVCEAGEILQCFTPKTLRINSSDEKSIGDRALVWAFHILWCFIFTCLNNEFLLSLGNDLFSFKPFSHDTPSVKRCCREEFINRFLAQELEKRVDHTTNIADDEVEVCFFFLWIVRLTWAEVNRYWKICWMLKLWLICQWFLNRPSLVY